MSAAAVLRFVRAASTTATLAVGERATAEPVPVVWSRQDAGRLYATVRFGPYAKPVTADGVVVAVDGEPRTVGFTGVLSLPAGVTFEYELIYGVVDV